MAAVCTLMGGNGFEDFEAIGSTLAQRHLAALGVLPDKDGVRLSPSDSTFGRVLAACEVREIAVILGPWLREQEPAAVARRAVDGKTLRGTGRRDGKPLQLFSAVTHHLRMTLQQIPIDERKEILSFTPLPRREAAAPDADDGRRDALPAGVGAVRGGGVRRGRPLRAQGEAGRDPQPRRTPSGPAGFFPLGTRASGRSTMTASSDGVSRG